MNTVLTVQTEEEINELEKLVANAITRALRDPKNRNPEIVAALGPKLARELPTFGGCGAAVVAFVIIMEKQTGRRYGPVVVTDNDPMDFLDAAIDPKTARILASRHLVAVREDGTTIDLTMAAYHQPSHEGQAHEFPLLRAGNRQIDAVRAIEKEYGSDQYGSCFPDFVQRLVAAGGMQLEMGHIKNLMAIMTDGLNIDYMYDKVWLRTKINHQKSHYLQRAMDCV